MNSVESLRIFFGWCSVLNIGLMMFSVVMLISLRSRVARIYARMFNLDEKHVS